MVYETEHQYFTNIDVTSLNTNFIKTEPSQFMGILFILHIKLEEVVTKCLAREEALTGTVGSVLSGEVTAVPCSASHLRRCCPIEI